MNEQNTIDEDEIERKFLISNNIIDLFKTNIKTSLISQSYLYDDGEKEIRIRKSIDTYFQSTPNLGSEVLSEEEYDKNPNFSSLIEKYKYTQTEKIGNGLKRREIEKEINSETYSKLLEEKISNTLYKTRYSFSVDKKDAKEIIIDTYTINDIIVAEIEYNDDDTTFIPEWLKPFVIKEITGMKEYSNKKMAFAKKGL